MKIEPRIEKKIFIKKNKLYFFINRLQINKATKIFKDRIVNSIYYDNNKFQAFMTLKELRKEKNKSTFL